MFFLIQRQYSRGSNSWNASGAARGTIASPVTIGNNEPMSICACDAEKPVTRWRLPCLLWVLLGAASCSHNDEVEPQTAAPVKCVVFDIDGTLTPKVAATRTARDGAATAVQTFADAGYVVVYLSARVRLLQGGVPDWLKDNGFPPGRLRLTESHKEQKDHAGFKASMLDAYHADGCHFVAAYGDSSSDFEAYTRAGISPQRIFALKREGEKNCQAGVWAGCYGTWEEQMGIIRDIIRRESDPPTSGQ